MKLLLVVQARATSTRLPQKIFKPLVGAPLLVRMLERLQACQTPMQLVVATTTDVEDDAVPALADEAGVPWIRGHPTDLLDRHIQAARAFDADAVAKIPSDCPLIDPRVVDRVLGVYLEAEGEVDYVSNLHPATWPDGYDVEVMSREVLETAHREAQRPHEREHTTPFIWDRNDGRFTTRNVTWDRDLSMSHRLTIDYQEDYELIRDVYEALYRQGEPPFSLEAILEYLDAHPEIFAKNAKLAGVNWYRHHLDDLATVDSSQTRWTEAERPTGPASDPTGSSKPDLFDLDGKIVVVTGSTGLLGRQHVEALSEAGAKVVCVDLDAQAVTAQAEDLAQKTGRPALGVATDITSMEQVQDLKAEVLATFGRIDAVVNNAAINDMFESPAAAADQSRFERYPLELWQRSLDVNVTGTFLICQVLGSWMAEAGAGSIVNVASTYGIVAPDQSLYVKPDGTQSFFKTAAYPVTKGAVLSFTRFLAAYWGPRGVRVNALSPGGVENGQEDWFVQAYARRTPLGRMAQPQDYRGALVFLVSDASRYMTGANLVVDGGWTTW